MGNPLAAIKIQLIEARVLVQWAENKQAQGVMNGPHACPCPLHITWALITTIGIAHSSIPAFFGVRRSGQAWLFKPPIIKVEVGFAWTFNKNDCQHAHKYTIWKNPKLYNGQWKMTFGLIKCSLSIAGQTASVIIGSASLKKGWFGQKVRFIQFSSYLKWPRHVWSWKFA